MNKPQDFWSRRRREVEAEQAAEAALVLETEQKHKADEIAEKTDQEILAEFNLPDPDGIELGDDVTGFMNKAVPERLRKRALRRLWRTNPVLACVDGLNDYDGDFTNAATDAPGVKTAYQVGKGLLRHVEALAEQEAAKEKAALAAMQADTQDDDAPTAPPEVAQTEDTAETTTKVVVAQASIGEKTEPPEAVAAHPRRMRLRFETETS